MRGSVKAVAADLVALVILIRNAVKVSPGRQRVMKRSVEDRHVDGIGQQPPACVIALEVMRIVQWRQLIAALNQPHDLIVHHHGLRKMIGSMYDPMADALDVREPGDAGVSYLLKTLLQRLVVIASRTRLADPRDLAARQAPFVFYDLILDRGTAGIKDQDFHPVIGC